MCYPESNYNGQAGLQQHADFLYNYGRGLASIQRDGFGLPPWIPVTALDIYKMDPKKIVDNYLTKIKG